MGTDLETTWPTIESSYMELRVEICCTHYNAVMVAL